MRGRQDMKRSIPEQIELGPFPCLAYACMFLLILFEMIEIPFECLSIDVRDVLRSEDVGNTLILFI